jgi:alpha-tubulin suppressor-like RCC1 family protein
MSRIPTELHMHPDERFIKKIAIGESHFLALLGNGQLLGAGRNDYG